MKKEFEIEINLLNTLTLLVLIVTVLAGLILLIEPERVPMWVVRIIGGFWVVDGISALYKMYKGKALY